MPYLTLEITDDGPLVELLAGVSWARRQTLLAHHRAVPPDVRIRGLVDTGASRTCIDSQVLESLGQPPIDQVQVFTSTTGSAPHMCALYEANLTLLHPRSQLGLGPVPVIEAHLSAQGIQALIGRDVLEHCLVVYDNQAGHFSLAF